MPNLGMVVGDELKSKDQIMALQKKKDQAKTNSNFLDKNRLL